MSYRRLPCLLVCTALTFAWLASAEKFTNSCTSPQFPSATPTNIDSLCGVAGTPGSSEAGQNQVKNNFCAAGPVQPVTIADLVALQQKVQQNKSINFGNKSEHPLSGKAGPVKNRAPLTALGEGNEVVLQGYVLIARQEGSESVNCGKAVPKVQASYDIHISIVSSPSGQVECSGVVAEMIPHHRPAAWTEAKVVAVASQHLPVRVTGQLFFDSSHTPCVSEVPVQGDPSRASLWEVHPIYKFDVCTEGTCDSGSGWVPLEEWKAK
jgi:hypothetical protein